LAYVSGVIRIQEELPADVADEIPERSTEIEVKPTAIPLLDSIVVEHRRMHKPVIVGDLKLSEFRRLLLEKGFRAEFDAGVLIVNGSILIRRQAHGRIVLEGGLNRDYYKIRHLLYGEHAIM
jgi:cleavage and polyadenylation specificity factor subunit 2